jgi:hypothetical protein
VARHRFREQSPNQRRSCCCWITLDLDRPALCRLPLQSSSSCTITQHRHTQDHCSQSLQLLTALVASLHRPQGALSSTSSHNPTHLEPGPRLPGGTRSGIPALRLYHNITSRSSRRHIPLPKRASLHPLAHEADESGLPLGCTIGHTPSYPSYHLRPGGRDQSTHLPTRHRPPSRTRQSHSSSSISFYSTITSTTTHEPHPVLHLYSCACARHRDNRLLRPPSQAQALLCVPARGS